ncbi:MAG: folate family ECF transporter S component [Streptococcaceae bacterium]|jgi:ECF transporter S component (folate family)|nr:folate family ECF transporter S component [Streptococcaceae bacterium]
MKKFPELTLSRLVVLAMLMALEIVLGRVTSIGTNLWQVSLSFVAAAMIGAVGGIAWSAIAAGVVDVVGTLVFSHYGYNWQFTLSAMVIGAVYGAFFYGIKLHVGRLLDWAYVLLSIIVVMGLDTVFFNSLWVSLLYGMKFEVAVVSRLPLLIEIVPRLIILMLVLPALQQVPQIRRMVGVKGE